MESAFWCRTTFGIAAAVNDAVRLDPIGGPDGEWMSNEADDRTFSRSMPSGSQVVRPPRSRRTVRKPTAEGRARSVAAGGAGRSMRSAQLWAAQVSSVPVSPNPSSSRMQNVHVPPASPLNPATARLLRLKLQAPVGNVLAGNAVTVVPLCASVPLRTEQNEWWPEMSNLASAELPPVVDTV